MAANEKKTRNDKNSNKKTITIISVVAALLIIIAAIIIFIWAGGRSPKPTDDTGAGDTKPVEVTENTNVVTTDASEATDDTAGADTSDTSDPDTADTNEPEPVPATSPVEISHETASAYSQLDGGGNASLNIDAPKIASSEYGDSIAKFNSIISDEVDSFRSAYDAALGDPDNNGGDDIEFKMSYSTYKNDSGIISVMLESAEEFGGAHDATSYKAINFELNGGNTLSLSDILLTDSSEYVSFIKNYILAEMRKTPDKYFSTADNAIDDTFDVNNFVITDSGLRFFFQPYDIAPFAEGQPTFDISYTDLAPFMAY